MVAGEFAQQSALELPMVNNTAVHTPLNDGHNTTVGICAGSSTATTAGTGASASVGGDSGACGGHQLC
jgi:hypothetical protein